MSEGAHHGGSTPSTRSGGLTMHQFVETDHDHSTDHEHDRDEMVALGDSVVLCDRENGDAWIAMDADHVVGETDQLVVQGESDDAWIASDMTVEVTA